MVAIVEKLLQQHLVYLVHGSCSAQGIYHANEDRNRAVEVYLPFGNQPGNSLSGTLADGSHSAAPKAPTREPEDSSFGGFGGRCLTGPLHSVMALSEGADAERRTEIPANEVVGPQIGEKAFLFLVCDGHDGAGAATYVTQQLPHILPQCWREAFPFGIPVAPLSHDLQRVAAVFARVMRDLDTRFRSAVTTHYSDQDSLQDNAEEGDGDGKRRRGSVFCTAGTCVVTVLAEGQSLFCANLGDCRAAFLTLGSDVDEGFDEATAVPSSSNGMLTTGQGAILPSKNYKQSLVEQSPRRIQSPSSKELLSEELEDPKRSDQNKKQTAAFCCKVECLNIIEKDSQNGTPNVTKIIPSGSSCEKAEEHSDHGSYSGTTIGATTLFQKIETNTWEGKPVIVSQSFNARDTTLVTESAKVGLKVGEMEGAKAEGGATKSRLMQPKDSDQDDHVDTDASVSLPLQSGDQRSMEDRVVSGCNTAFSWHILATTPEAQKKVMASVRTRIESGDALNEEGDTQALCVNDADFRNHATENEKLLEAFLLHREPQKGPEKPSCNRLRRKGSNATQSGQTQSPLAASTLKRRTPSRFKLQWLSQPHRVVSPKERERIEALGGRDPQTTERLWFHCLGKDFPSSYSISGLEFDYVPGVIENERYRGLDPSRTIGDFDVKNERPYEALSVVPEVTHLFVDRPGLLLVASDGIWDVLTAYDMLRALRRHKRIWTKIHQWLSLGHEPHELFTACAHPNTERKESGTYKPTRSRKNKKKLKNAGTAEDGAWAALASDVVPQPSDLKAVAQILTRIGVQRGGDDCTCIAALVIPATVLSDLGGMVSAPGTKKGSEDGCC